MATSARSGPFAADRDARSWMGAIFGSIGAARTSIDLGGAAKSSLERLLRRDRHLLLDCRAQTLRAGYRLNPIGSCEVSSLGFEHGDVFTGLVDSRLLRF